MQEPSPCPFCGKQANLDDEDTIYPSGVYWRYEAKLGMNSYHDRSTCLPSDGVCYTMHCPTPSGGCGAEISGDSKTKAIDAWNKRV